MWFALQLDFGTCISWFHKTSLLCGSDDYMTLHHWYDSKNIYCLKFIKMPEINVKASKSGNYKHQICGFLFACKSAFLGSIVVLAFSNGQENEVFRDKCVLITMFQIDL